MHGRFALLVSNRSLCRSIEGDIPEVVEEWKTAPAFASQEPFSLLLLWICDHKTKVDKLLIVPKELLLSKYIGCAIFGNDLKPSRTLRLAKCREPILLSC